MQAEVQQTSGQSPLSPDPHQRPRVSVVLPVYNEVDNIPILTEELEETFRDDGMAGWRPFEVWFVNDGSDDGTADLIDRYADQYRWCHALHLKRNWGQSAALAAGFDAATGEVIVPMDADLQNDPADIPQLLETLEEGYDCVSGWRQDRNDPLSKTIPSRIQTALAKLTGPDINDFGCTMKAYRAEALADIDLWGEGHRYIPAKLHHRGYSITETEVNHRERAHGDSYYGVGRLLRGFVDLVFHWFYVQYSTRPMHLFGTLGLVLIAAGVLVGGHLTVMKFAYGEPILPHLARVILSAVSVLVGVVVFTLGLLSELLTKLLYRDDTEYRIERVEL